jgi:hypothetical protein
MQAAPHDGHDESHAPGWLWRVLTHPRATDALIFLFAIGVIVVLSASPARPA